MESEEDAKDTLLDLKLKKRTFQGSSVKARLKTETVIRSYYPSAVPMGGYPIMPYGGPYGSARSADSSMQYSGYGSGGDSAGRGQGSRSGQRDRGAGESADKSGGGRGGGDGSGSPRRDGARRGGNNGGSSSGGKGNSRDRDSRKGGDRSDRDRGGKGHGGRDRKDGDNSSARAAPVAVPTIEINSSADFPPLPGDDHTSNSTSTASSTGQSVLQTTFSAAAASFTPQVVVAQQEPAVPQQVGYAGPFTKYSVDDIMQIVKNITEAKLPDTIVPVSPCCD